MSALMESFAPANSVATADAVESGDLPDSAIEVSVVIPCLNEADTVGTCVGKAVAALRAGGIAGEVIVADNGSVDGSQSIARDKGARVVDVQARGYGNALMGGIVASKGKYVIMGDADDSYDFSVLGSFVQRLREGAEIVQGCRLPSGGGKVSPGAMPLLHRWWGNPMFSFLARHWFEAPIHDIYCGMRGFTRRLYDRLDLQCTGMEFATEMIIKASLYEAKIGEVPITLHRDGRVAQRSHLKTFRDGWRTLRFFLMYSPRWLFVIPGVLAMLLGMLGYALSLPSTMIAGVTFEAHTLLFATVAILCGYQCLFFGFISKQFAIAERLLPPDPLFDRLFKVATLERGVILGLVALIGGCGLLVGAFLYWRHAGYGRLDYGHTMKWVIPGAMFTALGFQTILASFFMSILGMRRR